MAVNFKAIFASRVSKGRSFTDNNLITGIPMEMNQYRQAR